MKTISLFLTANCGLAKPLYVLARMPAPRKQIGATLLALALAACSPAYGDCLFTSIGVTPLNGLGPRTYKGFSAGLYPRGGNARPPGLDAAALSMAATIQPLDATGNPSPSGKIVMISIGMSNTTQEFASSGTGNFKTRAYADPSRNPQLVIVDGAQGGKDAPQWLDPSAATWTTLNQRLTGSAVTPQQVQVAWIKQAIARPNDIGAFPAHAQTLHNDLAIIARNLKTRCPNIRLCYVSSRTRAYTNVATALNPEPFAFEGGFSTKWLIEDQIAGRNNLNWDAAKGTVVAPLLCWGPYLWADGTVPRSDGFTWLCSDLQSDFTHPSPTGGVPKVGEQLLVFFKTDATSTPWFLKSTTTGQPPTCTAGASVLDGAAPLSVNFTASASDPDGSIASYQWTFGDGTFSTAQNPAKIFPVAGKHSVRLTITDNSGNPVTLTIPITVALSVAEWQRINFSVAETGNAAISGDGADPDSDGVSNIKEYALGLNPKSADAALLPVPASESDHLTMTYTRAKAATDVTVTAEVADDLAGPWSSGGPAVSEEVLSDDGVLQTILATDLTAMTGNSKRFMRLRIERVQ